MQELCNEIHLEKQKYIFNNNQNNPIVGIISDWKTAPTNEMVVSKQLKPVFYRE